MRFGRSVVVCAIVCASSAGAAAQPHSWSLPEILARARERAPQVASARLRVEEMRGRLLGASLRFQGNPQLDASVGNRAHPGGRSADVDIGLAQTFEPWSRRSARVAGAQAAMAQSSADVQDTTRSALRSAAGAYYRVLHATERIRLLVATQELAVTIASAADRRFKAGDIAVLELNLARAALARVRAEREAAEAARATALGDLQAVLGLEEDMVVTGRLEAGGDADLAAALQAASARPDLTSLQAGVAEAEAQVRLGRAFSQPDYGVGVRYSREGSDQIVLGGVTLMLPVYARGQEQRAVGAARAAGLRGELDAAGVRIRVEVRSAFEVYRRRLAAVRLLETEALPGADENETLTTRSFEVGQLGLPDLLVIRRELLETRSQYLDALLDAALARVDLDASAGVLR